MGNGLGVGHLQNHLGSQTKSPWPLKAQETRLQFPAMTEANSFWFFINSLCWPRGSCFICQESIIRATIVVRSLSHVWLFATSWTAACQSSLFFTVPLSFLRLMSIESVMPSNHTIHSINERQQRQKAYNDMRKYFFVFNISIDSRTL